MKVRLIAIITSLLFVLSAAQALALPTNTQVEFSVNGVSVATTGIDSITGFGTRTFTFTAAGAYDVRSFFDLDLSLMTTGFFNEYGQTFNSVKAGQSWEIDEPGYWIGDLHANFKGTAGFDNTIGTIDVTTGNRITTAQQPDDVAVGMGWKFNLNPGKTATLYFTASDAPASSLFYIGQFEAYGANDSVYFTSDLKIESGGIGGGNPIPEPSTLVLLGSALTGLAVYVQRRRNG